MPSDLKPHEKEEEEAERLIHKKPPRSRKYTERRGPKHDNRRRRLKEGDADLKSDDRDMSMNQKHIGFNIADVALRIFAAEPKSEKPSKPPSKPKSKAETDNKARVLIEEKINKAKALSQELSTDIHQYSKKLGQAFDAFSQKQSTLEPKKYLSVLQTVEKGQEIVGEKIQSGKLSQLINDISKWWSFFPIPYGVRLGILKLLKSRIDDFQIPSAIQAALRVDPKNLAKNKEILADIIDESYESADGGTRKLKDIIGKDDPIQFAALSSIYRELEPNPDKIDGIELKKNVDKLTKEIHDQYLHLLALDSVVHDWNDIIRIHKQKKTEDQIHDPEHYFENFKRDLGKFLGGSHKQSDVKQIVLETLKEKGLDPESILEGDIPKAAATSNETSLNRMTFKVSSYHGVVHQGHPSGPYSGFTSYDKRYFSKENYDSIIVSAKNFLDSDWLKYDWEGGSEDAKYRAALDLAIHTADSNLYQSKIDAETYDMLLNRLAGWDYEQFSDTILPQKAKRSAAAMNASHQNILRIASDLRRSNPKAAFEIVKNLRSLIAEEQQEVTSQQQVQQGQQAQPQQQVQQAQPQQQQVQQVQQAVSDEEKAKIVKDVLKGLEDFVEEAKKRDMDEEEWLAGFKNIKNFAELYKKTASARARLAVNIDLHAIEDMSDDEIEALNEQQSWIKAVEELIEGIKEDPHSDVTGAKLDSALKALDKAMGEVRSASVRVNLATLVRLAHSVPETRKVLLPIIARGKKKQDKKDKKVSKETKETKETKKPKKDEKKEDSKPEFLKKGKGKGKDKGKGKKKVSVTITPSDIRW